MKQFLLVLFATALTVFAADVTGNWRATAEGPNGSMERKNGIRPRHQARDSCLQLSPVRGGNRALSDVGLIAFFSLFML